MSWLGNLFTGNNTTTDSTISATDGTYAGVGQTTPSTLDYTSPTYTVGSTVTSGGYVGGSGGGSIGMATVTGTGTGTYIPNGAASVGVYNPNSTYINTYTSTGTYNPGTIHITGTNPTISTDKGKIELNALIELVDVLKDRLLILTPNFEKMEKYAALKKAYDHYKLMESMIGDEDVNKQ